jgi:hypothetical protein
MIALNDTYSSYVQGLLETMVFNKMNTSSGVERSAWNRQALQNFLDTFGFGVGNGSVRASSFPIAVLANLGFVGAAIFRMFFVRVLFRTQAGKDIDHLDAAYQQAARSACIASLIAATISGALIDLGLPFFVFAALACAESIPTDYAIQTELGRRRGTLGPRLQEFRRSAHSFASGIMPQRR